MLNNLLTSLLPSPLRANEAGLQMATILSLGASGCRQALMELDCLPFHVQLPTMLQFLGWDPNQPTAGSIIPKLPLHTGWECSCPPHSGREQMHLSSYWSKSICSHCDLDDTIINPAFTTLLYLSWTYSRCWPGPHTAQGMLATRKIYRASVLHSWEFYLVLLQSFILCKIETVCGTCMLHSLQKPFSPHPLFKTFI